VKLIKVQVKESK